MGVLWGGKQGEGVNF